MKKLNLISILASILCCLLLACATTTQELKETVPAEQPSAPKKVLIAKGNTEFENDVVKEVEKALLDSQIHVEIIDILTIANKEPDDYSAVLLLNAVKAANLRNIVNVFAEKNNSTKRDTWSFVFVSTIAGEDWNERDTNVDAVTSATNLVASKSVARRLTLKIKEILRGDRQ